MDLVPLHPAYCSAHIEDLTDLDLACVFSFLTDPESLKACRSVCRRWAGIADNPRLWKLVVWSMFRINALPPTYPDPLEIAPSSSTADTVNSWRVLCLQLQALRKCHLLHFLPTGPEGYGPPVHALDLLLQHHLQGPPLNNPAGNPNPDPNHLAIGMPMIAPWQPAAPGHHGIAGQQPAGMQGGGLAGPGAGAGQQQNLPPQAQPQAQQQPPQQQQQGGGGQAGGGQAWPPPQRWPGLLFSQLVLPQDAFTHWDAYQDRFEAWEAKVEQVRGWLQDQLLHMLARGDVTAAGGISTDTYSIWKAMEMNADEAADVAALKLRRRRRAEALMAAARARQQAAHAQACQVQEVRESVGAVEEALERMQAAMTAAITEGFRVPWQVDAWGNRAGQVLRSLELYTDVLDRLGTLPPVGFDAILQDSSVLWSHNADPQLSAELWRAEAELQGVREHRRAVMRRIEAAATVATKLRACARHLKLALLALELPGSCPRCSFQLALPLRGFASY